jgi:hypothetical protein
VIARLDLAGVAISARICIIVERSGSGDELKRVRPREMNHPFRLVTGQIVFGKLSAETIAPGDFNEGLNWGRSENTLKRPRFSRTTIEVFLDQAVDARVVVGFCVILSVTSVLAGDESDETSLRCCEFWVDQRDPALIDIDSRS